MDVAKADLKSLKTYPNNPRKGNVEMIATSLAAYGQYKPITVNKRTNTILAGNHTFAAAQSLGWKQIDVVFVDVDEETAAKIVAIDNRSSDLGEYDNNALLDLLSSIPELDGTGYEQDDLDDLIALLEETESPTVQTLTADYAEVRAGETGQNAVKNAVSLDEYRDRYAQKATRMLIADYANERYIWLIDRLVEYRAKNGIASNADAIIALVENETGEKAPSETE